jgi:hypothetical protein
MEYKPYVIYSTESIHIRRRYVIVESAYRYCWKLIEFSQQKVCRRCENRFSLFFGTHATRSLSVLVNFFSESVVRTCAADTQTYIILIEQILVRTYWTVAPSSARPLSLVERRVNIYSREYFAGELYYCDHYLYVMWCRVWNDPIMLCTTRRWRATSSLPRESNTRE